MSPNPRRTGSFKPDDLTGLVLAGGRSSRFGRDKARLRPDGIPLARASTPRLLAAPVPWTVVHRPERAGELRNLNTRADWEAILHHSDTEDTEEKPI